ncbi:MAG: EAL domain-containing protein [Desulfobulbaceae bacterium]|nr:EAL domain-containing protein [Desulfobulbaceae bacterium]
MKRKIVSALLVLFSFFASGAVLATYYITHSTEALSRLLTLHQIEDLRQHLIISIQTVQSDLYTVHTQLGQKADAIVENVSKLETAARQCTGCHHTPEVAADLQELQGQIGAYQDALSYYITASANRDRIEKLQLEAAAIGNQVLSRTESMSIRASRNLESMTSRAMGKIKQARAILFVTIAITFIFGVGIAIYLTRAVTGPIERLVAATRALAAGDLTHVVATDDRTEFGELAGHFNTMSSALHENYEKLLQEIDERRQAEEALVESEERYALAASGANDGLWDFDLRKNTIYYSYRWKAMLGYQDNEIGPTLDEWLSRLHETERSQVETKLSAHINGQVPHFESEYRIRHRNNSFRWMLARGLAVRDENGIAYRMAGSQTDITARKLVEEQLIHDAFHDSLTGLPNRALFVDRLQHVIDSAKRHHGNVYAVLFTDLDRFKVINDSMGHEVGDKLLIEVGRRLLTCLRPGDTVARLGGDEFAILLEGITSMADAEDIAVRILEDLRLAFRVDGQEFFTSQSIGIALKSGHYAEPDEIIRDADIAMYQAKANGGDSFVFFDTHMHTRIINRNQLEADMHSAIENFADFVLNYQPIMNLQAKTLSGFEALVRWQHPQRGMIQPLDFIPLAEETGMIIPLSKWILNESCRQLQEWQKFYHSSEPLKMSVNITSRLLVLPGFVDYVSSCLDRHGLDPGCLALEITESALLEHTEIAEEALIQLRTLGVHIHIDDFGTGYSSLSYLHKFPVDALKIDRSFIAKISAAQESQEIVKTILALAHNLNLYVIAEGLELDGQLSAIKGLECLYGQGFLFSKPLTPDDISLWIQDNSVKFS